MLSQLETNSPGLVVAVTIDGKQVWTKGYTFKNNYTFAIANLVCTDTVSMLNIGGIVKSC